MRLANLLLPVVCLGAAACTSTSGLQPAPTIPEPIRADNLQAYYVQVGDTLDIRLMLNPELNEEVTVRPDGRISTTVVRDEAAAGRTIPELTEALRKDYSHDVNNARLTILLKSYAPSRVYVGGEVAAPGEFVTAGSLSLSQAIARAGGTKMSGDDARIFIIRRTATNAPATFLSVRYNDVIGAHDPAADVVLAPFDVVYVPRTGIAEVYKWYNQYVEQFAHPSFGFEYLLNPGAGAGTAIVSQPTPTTPTR